MSEQETIQDIGDQEQPIQPEYEEPKTNTQNISAAILFMLSLLLLNEIALQKLNKYKQKYPRCFDYVQATQVTTLIGFFAGFILNLTDIINIREVMKEGFSSFFLIVLLPPILYESAINMEREFFYKNFGSILIFAVFGTLIASLSTAFLMYIVSFGLNIEHLTLTACIAFGALVSATDPVAVLSIFKEFGVDPILFSLIFGESILNDAVSIILFETTVESRENQTDTMMAILKFVYVFLGSILLGVTIGLLCAYILKHREQKRQDVQQLNKESQNTRETTILFVVPYVSYFISEGLGMSGIVSIMFCGISMARYALMNVDPQTRRLNKKLYHTLSYSFENLVFLFIGIGFVSFDLAWKECGFTLIFAMFAVIMLSRYINIGLISFILNKNRKKYKITPTYQFFIWYSGFRGAMAFALSLKATEIFVVGRIGNIMLTIVLCYAMLNIFINATFLQTLVVKFQIQKQKNDISANFIQEDLQSQSGCWNAVKRKAKQFDDNCLKKYILRKSVQGKRFDSYDDSISQNNTQSMEVSNNIQHFTDPLSHSQRQNEIKTGDISRNQDIENGGNKNKLQINFESNTNVNNFDSTHNYNKGNKSDGENEDEENFQKNQNHKNGQGNLQNFNNQQQPEQFEMQAFQNQIAQDQEQNQEEYEDIQFDQEEQQDENMYKKKVDENDKNQQNEHIETNDENFDDTENDNDKKQQTQNENNEQEYQENKQKFQNQVEQQYTTGKNDLNDQNSDSDPDLGNEADYNNKKNLI